MTLRRLALGLIGVAAALVAALPVGAKEGVTATLTTRISLDSEAGTRLKVAWRLFSVDGNGPRQPFGATGVFVRLLSASAADAEEGFAPVGSYPTGEYQATVVVPEGGIGDVEIGLMGWRSDATGTRRSDALFPITNDPVPGASSIDSRAFGQPGFERPGTSTTIWVLILVAGVLSALAILAVALVLRNRRSRDARPATDRELQPG